MKTPAELIAELEAEVFKYERLAVGTIKMGIAVRNADEKCGGNVVWRDNKDSRAMLEALMTDGGKPIGLILVTDRVSTGGGLTVSSSPFEEYSSDAKVKSDLTEICCTWACHFRDQLAQCGDTKMVTLSPWIQ
jgi:hypothetical protein